MTQLNTIPTMEEVRLSVNAYVDAPLSTQLDKWTSQLRQAFRSSFEQQMEAGKIMADIRRVYVMHPKLGVSTYYAWSLMELGMNRTEVDARIEASGRYLPDVPHDLRPFVRPETVLLLTKAKTRRLSPQQRSTLWKWFKGKTAAININAAGVQGLSVSYNTVRFEINKMLQKSGKLRKRVNPLGPTHKGDKFFTVSDGNGLRLCLMDEGGSNEVTVDDFDVAVRKILSARGEIQVTEQT